MSVRRSWQAGRVPEANWSAVLSRGDDGYRLTSPADVPAIDHAELVLAARFPDALRDLYLVSNGVFDETGQWFPIWPLDELIRRNADAYAIEGAPRSEYVGFGDDGTGDPFCVRREGGDKVFSWSVIDNRATLLADNLVSFWSGWTESTLPAH